MRCTSSSCLGKFQYLSLPSKSDSQVTYLFGCAKMRVRILLYSLCIWALVKYFISVSGSLRWKVARWWSGLVLQKVYCSTISKAFLAFRTTDVFQLTIIPRQHGILHRYEQEKNNYLSANSIEYKLL